MNDQLQLNLGSFVLPNAYGYQEYPKGESPVQDIARSLGFVFDAIALTIVFVGITLFAKLGT